MNKKKIITVVGARPQFIKAAALSRAMSASSKLDEIIVHSGQHYDYKLSEGFFKELQIPTPKYNLDIGSATHNIQIAHFLLRFEEILNVEKPDLLIVFGDTNTTAAAAISGAKKNIPVAHVEAGLREFDKSVPEEVNKLITDAVCDLYFTPTETGRLNLAAQGIRENVFLTGDISLDLLVGNQTRYQNLEGLKSDLGIHEDYVYMTCHREMITSDKHNLEQVLIAASKLDYPVIFPVHPRTRKAIARFGLESILESDNIIALEPIGFWKSQTFIRSAKFILTDSGGVIKEAYFHRTPAIILDKQTEWVETVNEGWNKIAGPNTEKILDLGRKIIIPDNHSSALGDGNCGSRIVKVIEDYL